MTRVTKAMVCLVLALVFAVVSASPGFAKEANQTKCPVLGSPINKNTYVDSQRKRIYFCCPPCIEEFEKNPEKYMEQLRKENVALENAPESEKQ